MKLLKIYFDHLRMFKNGIFELDLFAADKVPAADESVTAIERPIYTNNVIAFAGINASGKSTALCLVELASRIANGSPINGRGLPASFYSIFDGDATVRCLVWNEDRLYLIEAVLHSIDSTGATDVSGLKITDESVYRVSSMPLTKNSLGDWDQLLKNAKVLYQRGETVVTDDRQAWVVMVNDDQSVSAAAMYQDLGMRSTAVVLRETGFKLRQASAGLDCILKVFDSRIEHLEVLDTGRAFELKFKDEEPIVLSEEGLAEVLSSGTLRGMSLISRAMGVLNTGGYLLVDEIENHLNRQLVNVVIDLFASRNTNPHGGTLVFTTHYPQVLDHVHRKDNVFFLVRGEDDRSEVVKYSTRVRRIENKKSEVFASNYIKGTAPRYLDVKALKHHVESAVSHE